ncbi:hypothetical protein GGH94_002850 [Coemansia aciculifera]|uniref:Uncharacterized protein n=1 Tax=Coemansia aciculifera TaxID=417176 RepID=A0A9W8INC9_9FUNG|nr:hypothetical protein GGH94_002850 [Coemansia aciculifera]
MGGRDFYNDDDNSVIDKAGMALSHNPKGLLLPGVDLTTHHEAVRLCARDYLENHTFFNDLQYHNHLNHHLLAVFSMGASAKRLQEVFDINSSYQRPSLALASDVTITADNYTKYLSKEEYYPNYIAFYRRELAESNGDWNAVVSKYFFDPQVFPLAMSGLLHPFIQLGYGLEFKSEAIIACALAQVSIHKKQFSHALDGETFDEICRGDEGNAAGLSLLDILDRMRNDSVTAAIAYDDDPYTEENRAHAQALAIKYAKLWAVESSESAVKEKSMEVMSVIALVYGSLTRPGYHPTLEFGIMHNLTSSYFLPIFLEALSLDNQVRLLHAYVVTFLYMFAAKGCPPLYIQPELTSTNTHSVEASELSGGNPWMDVFTKAIANNDMHVPKAVRALWRLSLLTAFPEQTKPIKGYELPPAINCLYLARITVDSINLPTRRDSVTDKMQLGTQDDASGWAHGMLAFDEFWTKQGRLL